MKIKKEILPIDENTFTGEVFYGYTNKKEVIKEIKLMADGECDEDMLMKCRVMKYKDKNGEDYYFWGAECPHCHRANDGVWSYVYGE